MLPPLGFVRSRVVHMNDVMIMHERARVSVSASAADWPKRIRDMQYVDHDDFAVAH
eukprot:COSAG06_NODE_237_length_19433_cov_92.613961_16_plen_56_part_00